MPVTVPQPFVVAMETSVSGGARPTVTGTTNLPNGGILHLFNGSLVAIPKAARSDQRASHILSARADYRENIWRLEDGRHLDL
jgi:hypothetical protein